MPCAAWAFSLLGRVPELHATARAAWKCGAVFCPLFSAFGPDPVKARMLIATPGVAVTTSRHFERKIAPLLPDLALDIIDRVRAPTLLIVGARDEPVIGMNRAALARLTCAKELAIVLDATHLFEEPGTLDQVVGLATGWFRRRFVKTEGAS